MIVGINIGIESLVRSNVSTIFGSIGANTLRSVWLGTNKVLVLVSLLISSFLVYKTPLSFRVLRGFFASGGDYSLGSSNRSLNIVILYIGIARSSTK